MAHTANNELLTDLENVPKADSYLVAYSGGADSTALLYALQQSIFLKNKIRAIHINHKLQPEADRWQQHCHQTCVDLKIPFISEVAQLTGDSENESRIARRNIFQQHLQTGEILLTAHHQDDAVETILFRMMRGTGIKGITGIQQLSSLGENSIFRPLLNLSKSQILRYLKNHKIQWIEDPSNSDTRYARNKIRQLLMPAINQYASNAGMQILRTSEQIKQSFLLTQSLIPHDNPLNLNSFSKLSLDTLVTLIYHWLHSFDKNVSSNKQLRQFAKDIQNASADKSPFIETSQFRLQLWRKKLYLLTTVQTIPDNKQQIAFDSEKILELPQGLGKLYFSKPVVLPIIQVKYLQTGEKIKLSGHNIHKTVKKLFQQAKTPPWEKSITPFLYLEGKLIAVGDKWIDNQFNQLINSTKNKLIWQRPRQIF
ncbi:MAG: tRNA lysidine(34) synthetase TilS [Proteobacteria bacterium]|nr:tRNA lysidine(34) synthetase TilS [Pseudomonadota bacterium]